MMIQCVQKNCEHPLSGEYSLRIKGVSPNHFFQNNVIVTFGGGV